MAKIEATQFIAECKRTLARDFINDAAQVVRLSGGPGERVITLGGASVVGTHEVARVLRALADYVETV